MWWHQLLVACKCLLALQGLCCCAMVSVALEVCRFLRFLVTQIISVPRFPTWLERSAGALGTVGQVPAERKYPELLLPKGKPSCHCHLSSHLVHWRLFSLSYLLLPLVQALWMPSSDKGHSSNFFWNLMTPKPPRWVKSTCSILWAVLDPHSLPCVSSISIVLDSETVQLHRDDTTGKLILSGARGCVCNHSISLVVASWTNQCKGAGRKAAVGQGGRSRI